VNENLVKRLSSIAALAEPARRDLYQYVLDQAGPVSRDQAAAGTGLPRHAVKFHLDRLVDEGLLEVEYRRLTGRRGPGAGRPAKLYRRAAAEVSVSVPERRYELAARILADAVHDAGHGRPLPEAVARAAAAAGRRFGAQAKAAAAAPVPVVVALASCGYEPRTSDERIVLANCPFHALTTVHRDLVCGMNLEFVRAVIDESGETSVDAVLDPAPDRCCVRLDSHPAA
jgi:predicted ArsR family transcriptional regulator